MENRRHIIIEKIKMSNRRTDYDNPVYLLMTFSCGSKKSNTEEVEARMEERKKNKETGKK